MSNQKLTSKEIGALGEDAVCDYLKKQGYKIKDRNFHAKSGELDIVAENKECIVFVEVKTRSSTIDQRRFGRPSDSVNTEKKAHIKSAAREYLGKIGSRKKPRIDVIEVIMHQDADVDGQKYEIKHFVAAF